MKKVGVVFEASGPRIEELGDAMVPAFLRCGQWFVSEVTKFIAQRSKTIPESEIKARVNIK